MIVIVMVESDSDDGWRLQVKVFALWNDVLRRVGKWGEIKLLRNDF